MHGSILSIQMLEWAMILEAKVSIKDFPQLTAWCFVLVVSD